MAWIQVVAPLAARGGIRPSLRRLCAFVAPLSGQGQAALVAMTIAVWDQLHAHLSPPNPHHDTEGGEVKLHARVPLSWLGQTTVSGNWRNRLRKSGSKLNHKTAGFSPTHVGRPMSRNALGKS